jgi:lipopolysaccharide transport system permease protein
MTGRRGALRALADLLGRYRRLTIDMALREISEKYSGQVFGAFWSVAHPLILIATYIVIFRFVFRAAALAGTDSPRDYTVYILAGLIPWLACIDAMNKATVAIVGNASLVKQVVFPLEVLPAKGVLATALTQLLLLALLIGYSTVTSRQASAMYLLLPVLVALQLTAMLGVSYVLSSTGVYFRDVKDFTQIFGQIGVYFIPAFYLPDAVPRQLQWILYVNPFSHLIWCYQDLLYFGYIAHPWSWLVVAAITAAAFWGGYRVFALLKPTFANVL